MKNIFLTIATVLVISTSVSYTLTKSSTVKTQCECSACDESADTCTSIKCNDSCKN